MRELVRITVWILLLRGSVSFSFQEETQFKIDGKAIELEESNFESAISAFDLILIDFYVAWCGHCKRLAPQVRNLDGQHTKETTMLCSHQNGRILTSGGLVESIINHVLHEKEVEEYSPSRNDINPSANESSRSLLTMIEQNLVEVITLMKMKPSESDYFDADEFEPSY
ncbi:hypothetical protein Pint_07702 [Pistacia integerrima]|uniref:Uncharacterized protein n=1 Tax=Pistacia integerrima TaxID=434235 RepID=A0ACC0XX84_9ROSI|nr:hypothetical protein Pint_07702 [Pistacia integerrima]